MLPRQELRSAIKSKWISAPSLEIDTGHVPVVSSDTVTDQLALPLARQGRPSQLQPASLDLRLGNVAYRIQTSFLPGKETVCEKLRRLMLYPLPLTEPAILERGHVYLIPLLEELALPKHIHAKANPKSSTGRLDVFTRVITDASRRFDDIRPGYRGQLFLEIYPRSFSIQVRCGLSLNQLRLFNGNGVLGDSELSKLHQEEPLLYGHDNQPLSLSGQRLDGGLFMGVETTGSDGDIIGYKARKNSAIIDLEQVGFYEPSDFWEPIYSVPHRPLILEPEEFYILASKERVCVPPDFAAELMAYDTGSGELRTHYAGFFDPGFGYGSGVLRGAKAVLEVRPHDVPFLIEDGQFFCKLRLERTTQTPDTTYGEGLASHYQGQALKLSKQFRSWD